jgi:hypothetical protein
MARKPDSIHAEIAGQFRSLGAYWEEPKKPRLKLVQTVEQQQVKEAGLPFEFWDKDRYETEADSGKCRPDGGKVAAHFHD